VIVAHLSDLHLRTADDAAGFGARLDRVVTRGADHLVITGDLLDRWNPPLLNAALDVLQARGLLHAERLTIIHGNHDLASSGGHPRERSDLRRLVARFWDPPPTLAARKRAFYRTISERAAGVVAAAPPFVKSTAGGLRMAALDTVPAPWRPFTVQWRRLTLRHGQGAIDPAHCSWLAALRGSPPLLVLLHHYPLPVAPFEFDVGRRLDLHTASGWLAPLARWHVVVPMEIDAADRQRFWEAARAADVSLVLCGHVHRARLEHQERIAVGLNGQSGAAWAGRTIAYYRIEGPRVTVEYDSARAA
jgi:3',5'-cyclic AMP phosphodiesterase CpdA